MTEDEQQKIIWSKEAENLKTQDELGSSYFKPGQGENKIKFLDNGSQYSAEKKYDDEECDYVKFRVEVDGEEMIWDMRKSEAKDSKFGKIAQYAVMAGGDLEGEVITWFRQGEGTETNHVLMDLAKSSDSDSESDGEDVIFEDEGKPGDEDEEFTEA